jgi:prefoldin subunit 5
MEEDLKKVIKNLQDQRDEFLETIDSQRAKIYKLLREIDKLEDELEIERIKNDPCTEKRFDL